MIKKILIAVLLISWTQIASAQKLFTAQDSTAQELTQDSTQQKPENLSEKILVDEVMAIVGNKMILLSDFNTQQSLWRHQNQLRPDAKLSQKEQLDIFENMLIMKLLAIGAIADSLPTNDVGIIADVENRINNMTTELGSTRELEKMMNAPIYEIREMLTYQVVEEGLAQAMKSEIIKNATITPLAVKEFAEKNADSVQDIMPRQVTYSHIVTLPPDDYEAKMKVKEELMDIRKKIVNGSSFAAMARLYSEDKGSAVRGGEMDFMPLTMWESDFSDAVRTLTPNAISGVVETRYGFHIIQLLEKRGEMYRVRHILLTSKLNADQINQAAITLDSVANEIRNGNITFEEAALKYSDDKTSKANGGLALNVARSQREGVAGYSDKFYEDELMYDAQTILALKPGEVSDAYISYDSPISQKEVCKIVKLIKDYPAHKANIKEDYNYFETLALNTLKEDLFDKWIMENIEYIYVNINAPYNQSKFRYDWLKVKSKK